MSIETLFTVPNLLALLIVLAGAFIRGYSGFGSGLIMVPLLALIWGPIDAIIFTLSLGLLATAQMTLPATKIANWRDITPIIIAAVVVTPLGTVILVNLDGEVVKKIIAGLVLAVTVVSLSGWTYKGPRGILPSAIFGSISSFVNGVAAVGGPAYVTYLISLPEKPDVQRANMAILTGVMGISVLTYNLIAGDVSRDTIFRVLIFALPYVAGVWGGTKLFEVLPDDTFKRAILWFLLFICFAILIS